MIPVRLIASFLLICAALPLHAQEVQFPELTGRVVDQANMIDPADEQQITQLLAGHEQATGNQVVVVTVPNLQGRPIEEFGYQLGRHWGIGQQGEDNGALLLVGQEERKVRIEVGYGLEGELTDALSSNIINSVILPAFRQGNFSAGIRQGAEAMVQAIGGEYQPPAQPQSRQEMASPGKRALIVFLVFGGWLLLTSIVSTGGGSRRSGGLGRGLLMMGALGALSGGRGGFGGGGIGGGGFSGGGGGFGGGGASGGW